GVAVIVEAAHQPRVYHIADAEGLQSFLHPGEEIVARLVEVIGVERRRRDDRLIARLLGVEDAQRIALKTLLTLARQAISIPREIVNQHGAIGVAAFRIPERVDLELRPFPDADASEELRADRDHLDVALWLLDAEQLDAGLVELSRPSLLWIL